MRLRLWALSVLFLLLVWCVLAMDVDTGETWSSRCTWADRKQTERKLLDDIENG